MPRYVHANANVYCTQSIHVRTLVSHIGHDLLGSSIVANCPESSEALMDFSSGTVLGVCPTLIGEMLQI